MGEGRVFRRCGCRDATGKLVGARCPGLSSPRHGSWYLAVELPSVGGQRRRIRRGGYPTKAAAAGTDLKTVQDQLGHTTITLTADTYTTVLPAGARTAAENTARLLDTARRRGAAGSNAHRPRRSRLMEGGE